MSASTAEHAAPPSLLWPAPAARQAALLTLDAPAQRDLDLATLVQALDSSGRHHSFVRATLTQLPCDAATIAYRQAVLAELAADAALQDRLHALLPLLAELGRPGGAPWAQDTPLLLLPARLSDLERYVAAVNALSDALEAATLHADGWRAVREDLARRRATPDFAALQAELPALRAQLDRIRSVTIGINLDGDLQPVAATLVAIHSEPFQGPRTLAQRLLGTAASARHGATTLRSIADRGVHDHALARDLERLLAEAVQPLAQALERYARVHTRPLATLEAELAFYLGALQLRARLAAHGLPVCLPAISATRHCLSDAYHPGLALTLGARARALVCNRIDFAPGAVMLLTGPNRGGKTTYLRAIGLNQILFQAGIFVAARQAEMRPADRLLTHFPPAEPSAPGGGRLDDEAQRIRQIFEQATPASLLLFNEPLTSTGMQEALDLGRDLLRALRLLGARSVYVTHLHTLAADLERLNANPGAMIASWVAGIDAQDRRTYRIRPGTPAARSHAAAIAAQHGITFTHLAQRLRQRGVLPPES